MNESGELGNGNEISSNIPVPVAPFVQKSNANGTANETTTDPSETIAEGTSGNSLPIGAIIGGVIGGIALLSK